jgi:RNA polymerase sigma-70 factor (ECF subfamily)
LDQERFGALYREYYGDVLRYARRRVDVHAADDVVAETFLVALRRPEAIPSDPLPWLYGVARRVVSNGERSQRRAGRLEFRLRAASGEGPASDADLADEVAARMLVQHVLSALSTRDREILMLVAWEGLDVKQAARALGCTSTAAAVRLHRARRRLLRALTAAARTSGGPSGRDDADPPHPRPRTTAHSEVIT